MAPPSNACATFTFKDLGGKIPPASPDIGVIAVLSKDYKDTSFRLAFTDATLKDPQSGAGLVITAQRSLGEGVSGAISYDVKAKNTVGTVTLDKQLNGSDLQLRAIYKSVDEVFILEESWRFDANNKLSGSYNFATEEALFSYSYSMNDWTAGVRYNFQSDAATVDVTKRQGKNIFTASYCPQKEDAMIAWNARPYRVMLKNKVGKGGITNPTASISYTHEFEL